MKQTKLKFYGHFGWLYFIIFNLYNINISATYRWKILLKLINWKAKIKKLESNFKAIMKVLWYGLNKISLCDAFDPSLTFENNVRDQLRKLSTRQALDKMAFNRYDFLTMEVLVELIPGSLIKFTMST